MKQNSISIKDLIEKLNISEDSKNFWKEKIIKSDNIPVQVIEAFEFLPAETIEKVTTIIKNKQHLDAVDIIEEV